MFEKYDMLVPQGVLFNLKEIEDMKIIKIDMAKKLIYNNELEVVKIGKKIHITRIEIIKFLVNNTIRADESKKELE
ncbi:DNA-binding protein [Aliarcobacter cryaerophilus]|uniref:DNA-binding protein n=1 Tax=Aliarcobacter cryaerophilus TaxID=28198 RepID=UPI0021B5F872|nr:DNA-binding protein [Aliarcobacter cryaerophilus]MCT7482415.1 DNA-binding protein [Aliarcobacter cryaerophilus]